jgi:hypothetical protein
MGQIRQTEGGAPAALKENAAAIAFARHMLID